MKFEWDENKNKSNMAAHGIDFADAQAVFAFPMLRIFDDRRDYGEDRWIGIGLMEQRIVVVVFTESDEGTRRITSARKAVDHERKKYEEFLRDRLGAD